MASTEEGPEPLKYQTLTLKVSIHCEGCKKKVKKVLHSIEGVYKTTVDSQQQKVIVIGNVEAETLIKKLLKTGKHAELWPEKKPNNPSNSGGGGKKNKNKNKASGKPNEPSENSESTQTPSGDDSPPDSSANPDGDAPHDGGKDSPNIDNKEAGNSPPREKQDGGGGAPAGSGNAGPAAGGGGGGGGGKKKAKKGQKENSGGGGRGGGGEVQGVSEGMGSKPGSGGGGVVSLPAFSYAVYPTSQPPAYVVSYSTVQPSASYGGAYYPVSMNQSSYLYSGATVAVAAPGSYYMFSDENANACRIM